MRSPTARQDEGKPVSAEPTSTGRIAVGGTALRRVRDAARTSVHPRRALRNGEVTVQRPGFRFALPGLGLYSVFVAYPAVATAYYAFTNWNGLAQHWHFIGLKNFVSVLSSGLERTAFANTFEATVGIALGANILGLVVALLLQKRSRFNYVLRLLWFLPAALPSIVAGYIWTFIYSPPGPPSVVATTTSKSSSPVTVENTKLTAKAGRNKGSVTKRNRCNTPAPSTRAASCNCSSIACRPASKRTMA